METTKRIIWTSEIEVADWEEDIKEWYPDDELTEEEIYDLAERENFENLEADKENLSKELGKNIVMVARLGLWNGTRSAYKVLNSTNLNGIFEGTCGDYVTWYVENGEVCCDDTHHDGTNHYVYRTIKDGIESWEFEELIAEGKDIFELTDPLGCHVAEIYGWKEA